LAKSYLVAASGKLSLGGSTVFFAYFVAGTLCSLIIGSVRSNPTRTFRSVDTIDFYFAAAAFKAAPVWSSKLANFSIYLSIELYIIDSRCSSAF
jgi:hypothetical protein